MTFFKALIQLLQLTSRLRPDQKDFLLLLRLYFPEVWHQQKESCVANSITHMLTIIYRVITKNFSLTLSPSALLSIMTNQVICPTRAGSIIINEGLEERDVTKPLYEVVRDFQYTPNSVRYKVQKFHICAGP